MEKLIGSAPTDPGDTASWIEYVGWDDFGLFLGFSRPMWEDYDGVGRFVGWQLRRRTRRALDLRTVLGVGVGTTTTELRTVYGDTLIIPAEPDVCAALSVQLLDHDEGIVAFLDAAGSRCAPAAVRAPGDVLPRSVQVLDTGQPDPQPISQ